MAIPIKETPELKGKDAKKFENEISKNKTLYITQKEHASAISLMNKVLSNSSI